MKRPERIHGVALRGRDVFLVTTPSSVRTTLKLIELPDEVPRISARASNAAGYADDDRDVPEPMAETLVSLLSSYVAVATSILTKSRGREETRGCCW